MFQKLAWEFWHWEIPLFRDRPTYVMLKYLNLFFLSFLLSFLVIFKTWFKAKLLGERKKSRSKGGFSSTVCFWYRSILFLNATFLTCLPSQTKLFKNPPQTTIPLCKMEPEKTLLYYLQQVLKLVISAKIGSFFWILEFNRFNKKYISYFFLGLYISI